MSAAQSMVYRSLAPFDLFSHSARNDGFVLQKVGDKIQIGLISQHDFRRLKRIERFAGNIRSVSRPKADYEELTLAIARVQFAAFRLGTSNSRVPALQRALASHTLSAPTCRATVFDGFGTAMPSICPRVQK